MLKELFTTFEFITAMIDIIENDLLKKHMPGVSYLRLDGSVPANMRHEIVHRFNSDPSYDILLLTTQVRALSKAFMNGNIISKLLLGRRLGTEPYRSRHRDLW